VAGPHPPPVGAYVSHLSVHVDSSHPTQRANRWTVSDVVDEPQTQVPDTVIAKATDQRRRKDINEVRYGALDLRG
jgi:hypothetical protein